MHSIRWLRVLALAAVSAMALAACSGGSTTKTKATGTTAKPSTETSAGGSGFASLLQKGQNAKFRVTYTLSGGTSNESTMTFSQDPPKAAILVDDTKIVQESDRTVMCSGSGSDASCTQFSGSGFGQNMMNAMGAAFGGPLSVYESLAAGANAPGVKGKTTSEKIAGRSASCATLDLTALGSALAQVSGATSAQVCVDTETGALLRWSTTGGGSGDTVEATEFGKPMSSDFEIPVTPQTMPSMPGGVPGAGGS